MKIQTANLEINFSVLVERNISFLEYFREKNKASQLHKNFRHFVLGMKTDGKNKIL